MKPKKIIVLVDSDQDRQGVTSYLLFNKGFAVLRANGLYEAAEVGHSAKRRPSLLLAFAPASAEYLAEVAAGLGCPWLLISKRQFSWPSPGEVIAEVKAAAVCTRGPKVGHTEAWLVSQARRKVPVTNPEPGDAGPVEHRLRA